MQYIQCIHFSLHKIKVPNIICTVPQQPRDVQLSGVQLDVLTFHSILHYLSFYCFPTCSTSCNQNIPKKNKNRTISNFPFRFKWLCVLIKTKARSSTALLQHISGRNVVACVPWRQQGQSKPVATEDAAQGCSWKSRSPALGWPGQAQPQLVPQGFIWGIHKTQQKVLHGGKQRYPALSMFSQAIFPVNIYKVGLTSIPFQANPESTSDNLKRHALNAEIPSEISREIRRRINLYCYCVFLNNMACYI